MDSAEHKPPKLPKLKQQQFAKHFRDLHHAPELLVLPNAWDAGSARLFERTGFTAIGTTSAGIAFSLGYPDGQHIGLDELLAVQALMVRRLTTPLTVDLESGYGDGPEEIVRTVARVIAGGAVGINIEDGVGGTCPKLLSFEDRLDVIRAITQYRGSSDIPFVVNARTDSYWLDLGDEQTRFTETVARANAYLEAGADCVFVPGRFGRGIIEQLLAEIQGPLNVIASPLCPSPAELQDLGVARLSVGSAPVRGALAIVKRIAEELRAGEMNWLGDVGLGYDEANELFA